MAIFHVTDSLRFTVEAATCGATDGSTATSPPRPAAGSRSQATYSPMSSSCTWRQPRPRPARNTQKSLRSNA
jgi:hypothetical protein